MSSEILRIRRYYFWFTNNGRKCKWYWFICLSFLFQGIPNFAPRFFRFNWCIYYFYPFFHVFVIHYYFYAYASVWNYKRFNVLNKCKGRKTTYDVTTNFFYCINLFSNIFSELFRVSVITPHIVIIVHFLCSETTYIALFVLIALTTLFCSILVFNTCVTARCVFC